MILIEMFFDEPLLAMLFIIIFLFVAFTIVAEAVSVRSNKKLEHQKEPKQRAPQLDINLEQYLSPDSIEYQQYLRHKDADYELERKKATFYGKASEAVIAYINDHDVESATELILNVWNTRDKEEEAERLHSMLNYILYVLYKNRYDNDDMYIFVNFICDLDISNIENYAKIAVRNADGLCYMDSVQKKAIMLEKAGFVEDAISVCDIGIKYRVMDTGYSKGEYSSLERRKKHLQNKLPKHKYKDSDVFNDN